MEELCAAKVCRLCFVAGLFCYAFDQVDDAKDEEGYCAADGDCELS